MPIDSVRNRVFFALSRSPSLRRLENEEFERAMLNDMRLGAEERGGGLQFPRISERILIFTAVKNVKRIKSKGPHSDFSFPEMHTPKPA